MKKAKSLKEAITILDEVLNKNEDERSYILNMINADAMIVYHQTVGRDIRNQWKLWEKESELKTELTNLGIADHADDMSMFILKIFYYHVKFPKTPIEAIINEYVIKKLVE